MIPARKPDQHYPFTAREVTARDLANLGKARAAQSVSVSASIHNGSSILGPRYIVLVQPEGAEGEYYEVYRSTLQALQNGMTPAELELEPYTNPDDEAEPFGGDYCHADHFRTMLRGKSNA